MRVGSSSVAGFISNFGLLNNKTEIAFNRRNVFQRFNNSNITHLVVHQIKIICRVELGAEFQTEVLMSAARARVLKSLAKIVAKQMAAKQPDEPNLVIKRCRQLEPRNSDFEQ